MILSLLATHANRRDVTNDIENGYPGVWGKRLIEANRLLRRMAKRMSIKRGENYSSVVSFLRRRFRFDLLKTCVIAMREYKKPSTTAAKIDTLDLDLRTTASSC